MGWQLPVPYQGELTQGGRVLDGWGLVLSQVRRGTLETDDRGTEQWVDSILIGHQQVEPNDQGLVCIGTQPTWE